MAKPKKEKNSRRRPYDTDFPASQLSLFMALFRGRGKHQRGDGKTGEGKKLGGGGGYHF